VGTSLKKNFTNKNKEKKHLSTTTLVVWYTTLAPIGKADIFQPFCDSAKKFYEEKIRVIFSLFEKRN